MSKNTLNILVVSASSLSLARKIRDEYPGKTVIYCREADNDIEPVTSFKELTGNLFDKSETIVFIGAMGICVRSIAPYIKSKYTDPAVICLDSTGKYVVSVLSGHIGGANELTHELARILDAEAVVTTQSDNQGLWALDTFAKQYGWEQDVYNPQEGIISFFQTDFEKIDEETFNASREKAMNECVARFVNCRPTALLLDIRTKETDYMKETCPPHVDVFYKYKDIDLEKYELLITVSPTYYHKSPIPCLSFFPKVLHLGIGCKKGLTDMKSVLTDLYICSIFYRFNLKSIANVSSIDLKKEEPILKELADTYLRSPFKTYPAEVLDKVPVPHPSSTVKKATGSGSVAEAAAILSAEGGPLLVGKQKGQTKDFTYAIAISKSAIQDEEDSQQKGKQGHGHIEIVGAGPGDPELISIRGRRMLENADLILYAGSLVPKELTLCAKKGSTIRSSADMNLEEQFALIKKFYDKGKFIVRLHTGDPCIYGAIREQMDRLEEIAGKILKLVEEDPAKKNQAATFLNYYLPTTEKLLDSYADFEEAGVSGENLTQAKEKIRRTMDSIMAGFERQLDALYHADAMDVDSDIRVMETMLRRDGGSVEEDFGLGGTAVATQEEDL